MSLPHTDHALAAYYVLSPAEAMANLARYDGVRYGQSVLGDDVWETFARTRAEGFGQEVKRRILLGTYVLSSGYYDAYYVKAQQVRTLVKADFDRVFKSVDALLTPTTPGPAFRIGEKTDDPMQMYLSDVFTVPVNITGTCGISIPVGLSISCPWDYSLSGVHLTRDDSPYRRRFPARHRFSPETSRNISGSRGPA
jgi:aspartyl-tRNA(Asn)/glutamyl-tRNA(Gln) amidotransferase subunit A